MSNLRCVLPKGHFRWTVLPPIVAHHTQVEIALRTLPGLANVEVVRGDAKGISYYPVDDAATLWYASSQLSKSANVQTFDWDVTFQGLAGPQPLLQVRGYVSSATSLMRARMHQLPCRPVRDEAYYSEHHV